MRLVAFIVLAATLAVAGCGSSVVSETGPLMITSVNVTKSPRLVSETDIAVPVRRGLETDVLGRDVGGKPSTVDVELAAVTYKNPALSLLIGSTNSLSGTVTIRDEDGKELATFFHIAQDDVLLQGAIGAAQAAFQKRGAVDQKLAKSFAADVETRIFGAEPAKRAPAPTATPVRVAPPAPAEPAGAPVS